MYVIQNVSLKMIKKNFVWFFGFFFFFLSLPVETSSLFDGVPFWTRSKQDRIGTPPYIHIFLSLRENRHTDSIHTHTDKKHTFCYSFWRFRLTQKVNKKSSSLFFLSFFQLVRRGRRIFATFSLLLRWMITNISSSSPEMVIYRSLFAANKNIIKKNTQKKNHRQLRAFTKEKAKKEATTKLCLSAERERERKHTHTHIRDERFDPSETYSLISFFCNGKCLCRFASFFFLFQIFIMRILFLVFWCFFSLLFHRNGST